MGWFLVPSLGRRTTGEEAPKRGPVGAEGLGGEQNGMCQRLPVGCANISLPTLLSLRLKSLSDQSHSPLRGPVLLRSSAHDSLTVGLLAAGIRHRPAVAEIPEPLFPFPLPCPLPPPCLWMEGFSLDSAGQSFQERGRRIPSF